LYALGIDLGGANTKLALVRVEGELVRVVKTASRYFPVWKRKDELGGVLKNLVKEFLGGKPVVNTCLTMTAELCDVFWSKREGVKELLEIVSKVINFSPLGILTVKGELITVEDAVKRYLEVAAANWYGGAYLASKIEKTCLWIDCGSTTTDIIPVVDGRVDAKGRSDPERLKFGELVYTGVLRTDVSAVVRELPFKGEMVRVSSEWFSVTGDVHLILGNISEGEYTCETPDGRGKSVEEAVARLSRVICADPEMVSLADAKVMARYVYEEQLSQVTRAILQVLSRYPDVAFKAVVSGLGTFIAVKAARRVGINRVVRVDELFGGDVSERFTAVACAVMAAEKAAKKPLGLAPGG